MENFKIAVVGAKGKMGSEVVQVLKNDYFIVEIDKDENLDEFKADLVVDFGSVESSFLSAEYCLKNRVPLIVGSTGQSENEILEIKKVAEVAPLIICSNFSIGVAIVRILMKKILKFDIDDICIFEKHHKNKKDAPSGTAKELKNLISKNKNVQVISERGGEEIGTHVIDFYFGSEVVSIKHQAFSRKAFAEGVKLAVGFILDAKENGIYCFDEIVKTKFGLN